MLPPIATSRPASFSTWAISAVVVDLPLVPVMATNGASGALAPRSRAKSSMSPTIGTPASSARLTVQCGFGWVSGTPGASTNSSEAAPVGVSEIDERNARGGSALASRRAVVPGGDLGAAGDQRPRGRQPRAAEAEEGDALSAQGLDRRHRHLSFSEARPTIASTKAMIQKRMTICGSDQPSCSK